jgi:hypothetical protein
MSFGVCRMSVPHTETHILKFEDYKNDDEHFTGENMGSDSIRPVQRISDKNGSTDPNKWSYYDGVFDLKSLITWVEGEGRGIDPFTRRRMDWNSIDEVQWDNKPDNLDSSYLSETQDLLNALRNPPQERPVMPPVPHRRLIPTVPHRLLRRPTEPSVPVDEMIGVRAYTDGLAPDYPAYGNDLNQLGLGGGELRIRRRPEAVRDEINANINRQVQEHQQRNLLRREWINAAANLNRLFSTGLQDHDTGLPDRLITDEYKRSLDAKIREERNDERRRELIDAKDAFFYAYRQLRELYIAQGRDPP